MALAARPTALLGLASLLFLGGFSCGGTDADAAAHAGGTTTSDDAGTDGGSDGGTGDANPGDCALTYSKLKDTTIGVVDALLVDAPCRGNGFVEEAIGEQCDDENAAEPAPAWSSATCWCTNGCEPAA